MNLKKLREILKTKENENVTLEQLQDAYKVYKEISQSGYKTKNWTMTNLARVTLVKSFKKFVEITDLSNYQKTIFLNDNGYSATLSLKNDKDEFDRVLSIKIKNESVIMDLIDNYEFYLVS